LKKRTDIVIFIIFFGLAAVLSAVYIMERSRAIGKVRMDIESLHRQQSSRPLKVIAPERLVRMFPQQPELSLFVDGLYQHARKSGIRNLEVQTLPSKEKGPRTGGRKEERATLMRSYPLRIMMEGTYRTIAESIRLMQNSERFIRVVELEIQPGKDVHRAFMTLEIFSIAGPDAS
jgi:Tfp pilus assembly protein PilO